MDIRQKTAPFEFDGKKFQLTCNMNVLAEVQEHYGGTIQTALTNANTVRTCLVFLTAMLNDYADDQGWDVRYTPKQVGRKMDPSKEGMERLRNTVMGLVLAAFTAQKEQPEAEAEEKN